MVSTHFGIMFSNNIFSCCKLFGDNTSLLSVVNIIYTSTSTFSQGLNTITNWAFQWKMIFNHDLSKQAQEVIFSRTIIKTGSSNSFIQ